MIFIMTIAIRPPHRRPEAKLSARARKDAGGSTNEQCSTTSFGSAIATPYLKNTLLKFEP
jgi:hypothetical protein